jgi:uncharacterized membrane protein YoaK (UPF0700 family)
MRYNRDLLTALLMGFTAGYSTGNTKVRFNTFGGMMTGNTVKLGITMAQGDWACTGVYAACISMFALGTVFALYMIQKIGTLKFQHAFLLVFVACFVLTDGIALLVDPTPTSYNIYASLASSLVAFALGAQNLLSQKSGVVKANTTFMTGNIQKMAEAAWNAWQKRKSGGLSKADQRAAAVLFCTWISYVGGGACGAATASVVTFHWSLTPVALLYAAGMASMQIEPSKPKKPAAEKPKAAATDEVAAVKPTPNALVIEIAPAQQAAST